MNKNKLIGSIDRLGSFNISININYLEKGVYKLKIIHKNKIVKTISFIKE